jgi:GDP-4-dehydro-6-deoxy-D-mannose reductase
VTRSETRTCNVVTGALGFVGRHLTRSLLLAGHAVVGLGRHTPDDPPPAQAGPFVLEGEARGLPGALAYRCDAGVLWYLPCDLVTPEPIRDLLRALHPTMVYHLAAQSSAAVSFREPGLTFASNLTGTLNLLEALRGLPEGERPAVLAVGSAEEYGPHPDADLPLREDAALNPVSPYAVSKAAQTMLCRQYALSWGLPVITTRSFSHTGPGHDARFAFPSFARQIAAAEAGAGPDEILTGDLSAERDFLDVRDVVAAYRLLLKEGRPGEVYNVCSGSSLTIEQGLRILVDAASCPITVRRDPERCRPSDTPRLIGDNTKLRTETGWEPEWDPADTLRGLLDEARKEFA